LIGFRRVESLQYELPKEHARGLLLFPYRLSARGVALFTAHAGLRFESLAIWLDDSPTGMQPTLVVPSTSCARTRATQNGKFANADDLEKLQDRILGDLRERALPFIERYSHLVELRRTLESPDKKEWLAVGLNVDTRVTTLAAIQVAEGDKSGALKTLGRDSGAGADASRKAARAAQAAI
jgi:hypothetical protein